MSEIIHAASGHLAGFAVCPVDWDKFIAFKTACYAAHIPYLWGGKDPDCGEGVVDFDGLDCSGFFRTLLMYATGGPVGALRGLPDGSFTQGDWLAAQGFKATTPDAGALCDGHMRAHIHHPNTLDETGHVWLTVNGHTVESFGGHGPGERVWNARLRSGHTLDQLASLSFVLV